MFAGLPGIGVGTLFYVLIALWMPVREMACLLRGESSLARWRVIASQLLFAAGIIASVALADRAIVWMLGAEGSQAAGPARWLNEELGAHAPESVLAAPIMASVLLLAIVLTAVQVARLCLGARRGPSRPTRPAAPRPHDVATPIVDGSRGGAAASSRLV